MKAVNSPEACQIYIPGKCNGAEFIMTTILLFL